MPAGRAEDARPAVTKLEKAERDRIRRGVPVTSFFVLSVYCIQIHFNF